VIETVPGQAMLKCSQPSQIMTLHRLWKAIFFLSPVLFIPSLYYAFLIQRIFIYLYTNTAVLSDTLLDNTLM